MELSLLRENLNREFSDLRGSTSFSYDLKRIIDDFILLSLFVGNDYIPHLPNLHIDDGALKLLVDTYKKTLKQLGKSQH